MGLDAYFYRHTKVTESDVVTDDLFINAFQASDELKVKLNKLSAYAKAHNKFLYECLSEAITAYLGSNGEGYNNEILYFRKFHFLLDYFDYDDEWYAKDMTITKAQCAELRDKAKVCLEECEKFYKEHEIYVRSYLTDSMLADTRNYERSFDDSEYIGNTVNEICYKHFPCSWKDTAMYDKVGHLYTGMNSILEETDWDKQTIIFNADW